MQDTLLHACNIFAFQSIQINPPASPRLKRLTSLCYLSSYDFIDQLSLRLAITSIQRYAEYSFTNY